MKKKPLIILLGGSSGVGTSTVSVELSKKLDITHVVETDYIREVLRGIIEDRYSPILHRPSYNAYEALPGYEWLSKYMKFDKLVLTGFVHHISMISPAVGQIIERAVDDVNNLIIEGVHWCDDIPLQKFKNRADIHEFILSVDEEIHKGRFLKRAMEKKRGEKHLGYFDEIRITHDYLVTRAKKKNIPVIDTNRSVDDIVRDLIKYINRSPEK